MSQFVNYSKRGITLPPGCKDLIDVLKGHVSPAIHGVINSAADCVTRGGRVIGNLSEIGTHVKQAYEVNPIAYILMMAAPNEQLTVNLIKMQGSPIWANVDFQESAKTEKAVQDFFARSGLQVSEDRGIPDTFFANLPWRRIYRILPMPSDSPQFSKLITDLFFDVCGLGGDAQISYDFHETAGPASSQLGEAS